MADVNVTLDALLFFTGASATTNTGGDFVDIGVSVPSFAHPGGPLQVEFSGFNFAVPSPSNCGLDLRLEINGAVVGSFARFAPNARSDPGLLRCTWSTSPAAGAIGVAVRGRVVLYSGPPPPHPPPPPTQKPQFHVTGAATLRLTPTAAPNTITLSPADFNIDPGGGQGVDVRLASPRPAPVPLQVTSRNGFVFVGGGGAPIAAGSDIGNVVLVAQTGGTDFVTVTADGFLPATATVHVKPVLSELRPPAGSPNRDVTLLGRGFAAGASVILGNSTYTRTTFIDGQHLVVRFTRFRAGPVSAAVVVNDQQSASLTYTVGPVIDAFTPTAARIGDKLIITGDFLADVDHVTIGGAPAASFTKVSDTRIDATVPVAANDGAISVAIGGVSGSAAGFHLIAPHIDSFTPTSGPFGTKVTIKGQNFTGVKRVKFGSGAADMSPTVTDTQINATVPNGARDGPIAAMIGERPFPSTASFNVLSDPAHLQITSVGTSPAPPLSGRPFTISVVVKNTGELPSVPYTIRVSVQRFDPPHQTLWGPTDLPEPALSGRAALTAKIQAPSISFLSVGQIYRILAELVVNGSSIASSEHDFTPSPP